MGFIQGSLAEAKFVSNDVFPKPLLPAPGSNRNLAESVVAERKSLVAALRQHRALLFRGFDVASVDDFERVVEAFQWDGYKIVPGNTTRAKLSDHIYTANEASPELFINFHHEISLLQAHIAVVFPAFLHAAPQSYQEAPWIGIIHACFPSRSNTGFKGPKTNSALPLLKMEERLSEFIAKAAKVGLIYGSISATDADADTPVVINKTWKSFLDTDDEAEAEKSKVDFFNNDSAEFVFGPLNPVFEREGKQTWIIPIHGCTDNINMATNRFGDGNAFPSEVFGIYKQLLEENCVDIKWQKGDVLLLDNFVVQHARKMGKPP